MATLHIAAALSDATRLPGVDPPLLEDCFSVPTGPGLGVEVDEARLRA